MSSHARETKNMEETNPFLGRQILKVVRNQLHANDPPETKQTYERLLAEGHAEDDVMKMLACVVVAEMYDIMNAMRPFDHARFVERLNALPELPE